MAKRESPLQKAERLVAEQEQRIARQLKIIDQLAEEGRSTEVVKDTLVMMERMLTALRLDRDWLEEN